MLSRLFSFAASTLSAVLLVLFFVTAPAPSFTPANAYFQETIIYRSGLQGTKTLALTFDDGPSAYTGELLEVLSRHGARATFFVVGSRVRQHPQVMERMARDGHVIANHSFSHARLGKRYANNPHLLIQQIGNTHEAVKPYARADQGYYFRAPYGVWRRAHASILNEDAELRNYVGPIYWDVGGNIDYDDEGNLRAAADWDCWAQDLSAEQCGQGYLREIRRKKGGVVLMHDIRQRSLWMVSSMLPVLVAEGYSFITLDEVRTYDQYRTPQTTDVPVAAAGFTNFGLMQH